MDMARELLRIYVKSGNANESTLGEMFNYIFMKHPMSQKEQIDLFMVSTSTTNVGVKMDFINTWIDLGFPTDEDGNPFIR